LYRSVRSPLTSDRVAHSRFHFVVNRPAVFP